MVWLVGGLGLLAWGLFCLLRAPHLAEGYRRSVQENSPHPAWRNYEEPLVSPTEWRAIGVLLCVLGLWCLFMSLP